MIAGLNSFLILKSLFHVNNFNTVGPQKWKIFSFAQTPSFMKTAIFKALLWFYL